jgi:hypothetical protein
MSTGWQYGLLALFAAVGAGIGVYAFYEARPKPAKKVIDEWDFKGVPDPVARRRFLNAADKDKRPRGVWIHIFGNYHVRLTDTPGGAVIMEIAPNVATKDVTWPLKPGPARISIFFVSAVRAVDWIADVMVGPDGDFQTPIDAACDEGPIQPEQLACWAKRLGMDYQPEDKPKS